MDHNLKTDVSLIFGKRGSGKSTLAKELLKQCNNFIVIDRLGEYSGKIVDNEIQALAEIRRRPDNFKIIIRLKEDRPKLFDVLYCLTNYVLMVEELSIYCNSYKISSGLNNIMAYGRHKGISFIGISQRPAQLHPLVRTQANIIYSFKMNEPGDQKYLASYGITGLEKLKQFQYIRKEV